MEDTLDFELTEEQRGVRDSTRGLVIAKAPLSQTRLVAEAGKDFDQKLWRIGAELGWASLTIAESEGGLGQQLIDLALVLVEHGRQVLPSPLIPTAVTAEALVFSQAPGRGDVLPTLLDGSENATWAFAERGRSWLPASVHMSAKKSTGGFVLNGAKAHCQDAADARWLLVDTLLDDQLARFLVDASAGGVHKQRQHTLDVTRAFYDVTFDNVEVPDHTLMAIGHEAEEAITRSLQIGAVLACAELVGLGERMLEMTVQYAKERIQFGRAIGSFQAVKHKCADMRMWVQAATAATYYAAMAFDHETADRARAVSVAKSCASEAIAKVAGEALQLHGGIGFTWEHDLHLYLRRTRTDALLYGDVRQHREMLCRSLNEFGANPGSGNSVLE